MKQIIAMGGGGFSMEADHPVLDEYILKQSKKSCPKICFIPTASGDAEGYIARFYAFFEKQQCIPTHLSLFKPPVRDFEAFLLNQDIIYVGGGNTKNLLVLWREWGLDVALKKAWEKGVILAGISAGAICWFEEGVTDSYGDELESITCLGFLHGSSCPHYDGEVDRKRMYFHLMETQKLQGGVALDDGVAIHYVGQNIKKIVSSRRNAYAYSVKNKDGIEEKKLDTYFLGDA
ncbi:peptidase E [Pseudalkalibacillus hwajinpoensis]|uniref:Peptidase E n=1 Tax=Guptibacillus hwajinpoensis TaxID=208199 RepID=A0A4U1MPI9_9BACL|nr:peptidase E [Pseudalkalibacillus hwajinpoensis]TKD72440.1 peptidase E [Pseudalkalibacillus hwajinpoensis]